jgi:hypothetical protein
MSVTLVSCWCVFGLYINHVTQLVMKREQKVQWGKQDRISSYKFMAMCVHEVARYTEALIRYNILISRKLQYLETICSWRCLINHFLLYKVSFTSQQHTAVYFILFIPCIVDNQITQYSVQQNALYCFQIFYITISC